ncbi:MAG TPA: serine hydrolase [Candidatus Limnocylindrales bacterium]|nr:serine hydrolase [Candidatus Limnocylindrales bacterium]
MQSRTLLMLVALLLGTNVLTGFAWAQNRSATATVHSGRNQEAYGLLANRIFAEDANDVIINFSPLRTALNMYFDKNIPERHSFYFEYLPTGTSIRINSNEELIGASLLKLPVVMNLYKAQELGKVRLDQTVTLKQEWLDADFGTLYKRGAGAKIMLQQAADMVLQESDNTAVNAILDTVNPLLGPEEHALVELDTPHTIVERNRVEIGAQPYSSLLKCLYFSCFLNENHSQMILERMTKAEDYGRIAAGVPDSIPVAHKIGTFSTVTQGDCGIVYNETRPFIVCMLLDEPDPEASRHIKEVTALIYQYVSSSQHNTDNDR